MSNPSQDSILSEIMESGEFSDLMFVCNGEEFKVHKVIICTQSPVIKAAVQGGFQESQTNTIAMEGFHPSTVKRLVRFMYTGDYETSNEQEAPLAEQKVSLGSSNVLEQEEPVYEAEGLLGNQLQLSVINDSSAEAPTYSPPTQSLARSTAATSLLQHVRINSIGDYYKIDKLVSLANAKIMDLLLNNSDDQYLLASLPTATEEALRSTGNDELLNILASATAMNISTLDLDQFKSLGLMSDFSIKVLQSCAQEIQALTGKVEEYKLQVLDGEKRYTREIELQKEQTQQSKAEISRLRGGLEVLQQRSACRNCGAEFLCWIDRDECLLRCAKCRCKHYS